MKAYLNKEKIIAWFMENSPEEFLLAKLNNGLEINETTYYDVSWIDKYDGWEVIPDERDRKILKISFLQKNRLGDGYEGIISLQIHQPEEDAWIDWRDEVPDESNI